MRARCLVQALEEITRQATLLREQPLQFRPQSREPVESLLLCAGEFLFLCCPVPRHAVLLLLRVRFP